MEAHEPILSGHLFELLRFCEQQKRVQLHFGNPLTSKLVGIVIRPKPHRPHKRPFRTIETYTFQYPTAQESDIGHSSPNPAAAGLSRVRLWQFAVLQFARQHALHQSKISSGSGGGLAG